MQGDPGVRPQAVAGWGGRAPRRAAGLVRVLVARVDWRGLLAFGLPFALYVLTMAPTIYNLDSAELTTAAATGGLMRATGYPLYLLIGRVWSRLPVGDVGYRMNLLSALCGALTIFLADRVLRHLRVGPWAAGAALGLLAAAPYFWGLSLIAEVYTLHTALMAGIVLLLVRWAQSPTPWRFAQAVFLAALSLGHHGAAALLVPGCVFYALAVAPRRVLAPRTLALAAGALALGLSVYLYLPLVYFTAPAFNYAGRFDGLGQFHPVNLASLGGLWWLTSGRAFGGYMFDYATGDLGAQALHFAAELWAAFFAVGVGPGLLGLAVLARRDCRTAGMLALMFLFSAAFFIDYRVPDKDTMFLPAYLVWALWAGVGFEQVLTWLRPARAALAALPERALPYVARAALVGVVAAAVVWTWPRVDLSQDYSARERGEMLLKALQPDALVFGDWDTISLIQYLQLVEGQRRDVTAINRFLISPEDTEALILQDAYTRPVYINYPLAHLLKAYTSEPVGPLYHLQVRVLRPGARGGP